MPARSERYCPRNTARLRGFEPMAAVIAGSTQTITTRPSRTFSDSLTIEPDEHLIASFPDKRGVARAVEVWCVGATPMSLTLTTLRMRERRLRLKEGHQGMRRTICSGSLAFSLVVVESARRKRLRGKNSGMKPSRRASFPNLFSPNSP